MLISKTFSLLWKSLICLITNLTRRRQNLSLQSTFSIKFYQPEEDPIVGQISNKDFQCFLYLVGSILNSGRETNWLFIFFRVTPCKNFIKRYKVKKKYANILRHIQFINDVSDVLQLSSGCNSGLQNFN